MTGPKGNCEFCFPETLNVPRGKPEWNNTRAKRLRMRKVSIFKMAVANANFTTRTPFLS